MVWPASEMSLLAGLTIEDLHRLAAGADGLDAAAPDR